MAFLKSGVRAGEGVDLRAEGDALLERQPVELVELPLGEGQRRAAGRGERGEDLGRTRCRSAASGTTRDTSPAASASWARENAPGGRQVEGELLAGQAAEQRHHHRRHEAALDFGIAELRALGATSTRSQAVASPAPPASARPCTTATTGLGSSRIRTNSPPRCSAACSFCSGVALGAGEQLVEVGAGAEVLPRPAQRHHPHVGVEIGPLHARRAGRRASAVSSALRLSGRLSVERQHARGRAAQSSGVFTGPPSAPARATAAGTGISIRSSAVE